MAETQHPQATAALVQPMLPRDPHEAHRISTPLELLFDLCFVVAIAQAAAGLHHAVAEGHVAHAVQGYGLVFFAIWWAWMNFTWFASAYDTDDVPYRLLAFVQIAGGLVIAAGVSSAFEHQDFRLVTYGYTMMRAGLILQWLRAAATDVSHRKTALRYALGVFLCQIGWLAALMLTPQQWIWAWLILAPAEVLVPVWAERAGSTPWHAHHIAERYGLMTLIVLGESVLSATLGIQSSMQAGVQGRTVLVDALCGLVILFSMWWLYFERPAHGLLVSNRRAFLWGYGHLVIFASVAAVGAGLAVALDQAAGKGHGDHGGAAGAVTVPVGLYLLALWLLHGQLHHGFFRILAFPAGAALVFAATTLHHPIPAIAVILAGLVLLCLLSRRGRPAEHSKH